MELKFGYWQMDGDKLTSSNRTFMELKCRMMPRNALRSDVLIAPLWN